MQLLIFVKLHLTKCNTPLLREAFFIFPRKLRLLNYSRTIEVLTTMAKKKEAPNYIIEKTRYGLYESVTTDGQRMVTALTEDACRQITNDIHIPVMLGTFDGYTSVGRNSTAVEL